MPRLSIDISQQQHHQLKTIAAISGQSIKDFVLSRTFADLPKPDAMSEEDALAALRQFLEQRMEQVSSGQIVSRSADDIKLRARAVRNGDV